MPTSSNTNSFKGVFTAIVTPFLPDGSIDWKSYERIVAKQIDAGIHGIVVNGTTGESPTVSSDEKKKLIERTLELCKSKALVIAGTGSNDTIKTIQDTKAASSMGVDAALVVTPYYNKPTQKGLEEHFNAVADESAKPVILYNVPGRTGVSLQPATVAALAKHAKIAGIKEASGNLGLLTEIKQSLAASGIKKSFTLLSGDDPTFWPFLACGGDGVISVASNILPRCMIALLNAWNAGHLSQGTALHDALYAFLNGIFIEPNPVPIKALLSREKLSQASVRRPLCAMGEENQQKLFKIWDALAANLRKDQP